MTGLAIGLDLGTTGTKCLLFSPDGGIVAQAHRNAALSSPRPSHAEADPAQWLRNCIEAIREVLERSGVRGSNVSAVTTSGMVPAVVTVNGDGHPVGPAILQNDARAAHEVADLSRRLEAVDLVSMTGSALTQQSVAPTLRWLAHHEPERWAETAVVMGSYDWLLTQLGARWHVEQNWAIESGLFDLSCRPLEVVATAAQYDLSLLPDVATPGTVVGQITPAMAEATGLTTRTQLVVGGADHVLSAVSAGVHGPGDWLIKLGGAGDVLVASDTRITDPRLYLDAHPQPGHWLPNGCMATSGSLIRWSQELVGGAPLPELDAEAALRPPADVLCLPYFLGEKSPLHDPLLRGSFAGLHLGHTRADIYRSVLEAIAFGFRHHVEVFREVGVPLGEARITNGGSRSTLWKRIHADVLGVPLFPVADHPGASLGAALIGSLATGGLTSWDDLHAFVRLEKPVVPDPQRVETYAAAYAMWRELGSVMTPISHRMASGADR